MYSRFPTFVLGFHGCDKKVCDKVLLGGDRLLPKENDYDWLGHGIYFWENNPQRALEYAQLMKEHPERCSTKIEVPAVIGAVIDLGNCLNLLDSRYISIVEQGYQLLKLNAEKANFPLPQNTKPTSEETDLLIRKLDCAVIEVVHKTNSDRNQGSFDTVRGVFEEGELLYSNAGFKKRSHIQVCVRNPNCIKGYFLPLDPVLGYEIP